MSVAEYSRHVGDITAMRSPAGSGVAIARLDDGGLLIELELYGRITLPVDVLRAEGGDAEIVADIAADVIEGQAAVMVASIRARLRRFEDDLGDALPPDVDETTVNE
jgi:hypothetical protein